MAIAAYKNTIQAEERPEQLLQSSARHNWLCWEILSPA